MVQERKQNETGESKPSQNEGLEQHLSSEQRQDMSSEQRQDMSSEQRQDTSSEQAVYEAKKLKVVIKFLSVWFGSILILVVIALLSNIEWARRHIESALCSSFHREVRLGRLSWSFGLQGLAIESNKFEMKEKNGGMFISSGPSAIGIALLPLLQKRLVVKHLDFQSPEVWACKISDKEWNFSDLITEGPEIRMIQIEKGKLHLLNMAASNKQAVTKSGPQEKSGLQVNLAGTESSDKMEQNGLSSLLSGLDKGDWHSFELQDLKLSLTLPHKQRKWPVFFSCKIPQEGKDGQKYESSVSLSLTGKGPYEDWRSNEYSVDLKARSIDPSNFRSLLPRIPELGGLFDLEFKGKGIFSQGFAGTIDAFAKRFRLMTPQSKQLEIENAQVSASLLIDPSVLAWQDLKLKLDEWQLESKGRLKNWQKEGTSYDAVIGGQLNDLKGFFNKVVSCFLAEDQLPKTKATGKKLEKLSQAAASGKGASGIASIELELKGTKDSQSVATKIKAEDIPLAQLIDDELGDSLLSALKVDPQVPIRGELLMGVERRLDIKMLEIPMDDSKVKLSGFLDLKKQETELNFEAENLSFDSFKKRISSNNEIIESICVGTANSKPYRVSGKLDLKGTYSSSPASSSLSLQSNLKGLSLTRSDSKTPSCKDIRGKISFNDGKIEVKQLAGKTLGVQDLSSGDFHIDGFFNARKNAGPDYDFDLRAHAVSIVQLRDWLGRFGVHLNEPGFSNLSGDLQDLSAHINTRGTSFKINPANLLVNLRGGQQFKLSSGTISYKQDQLKASDVVLSNKGGKLTFEAEMRGSLERLLLNSARISTDGFELADLHSLLKGNIQTEAAVPSSTPIASSTAGSSSRRTASSESRSASALPEFLMPSTSSKLHGKVYGDMQFGMQGKEMTVAGVIGFNNAGGKFGKSQVAVEKLSGVAVISRDQIVLQETTGLIGKSNFSLDGTISDYAEAGKSSWEGQLRGQFYPEEVQSIMANLGHGIMLGSKANDALNLRVTGNGQKSRTSLTFSGRAAAGYGMKLKTAFGTFFQPHATPLSFKGGLLLDEARSQLDLNQLQLSCGSELLNASGNFKWADESAEKPASIAFSLSSPNPISTATLLDIIAPEKQEELHVSGNSQLRLKVEGPVNNMVLSGFAVLEKNSLPTLKIENLSGRLDFPAWHLSARSERLLPVAKMKMKTLTLNGVMMHDLESSISIEQANKFHFKDSQAVISGGKLKMSGFYRADNQACRVEVQGSKLVVDEMVKDLLDHSGGVSGLADIKLTLESPGGADAMRRLTGSGHFNIYQGSVASFGKLQEKLSAVNLLQQGLFGFNVNNLFQALMPVKSGQFNEISGELTIGDGRIYVEQLRFEGNNLRMRAAGSFDYLNRQIEIDVAGDIPRVSSSLIPGALGEMSRKVTLQRMFSIVTFRKLKDLPALPLLGDIANDDPRAFAFSAKTAVEPPRLITQAVEKSFRWLPNRPLASAHPVPGI